MSNQDDDALYWEQVEEATELLLEGEHEAVLGTLRAVLERAPQNPYAYYYLGVAFYELSRRDAARDAYQAALRNAPDYLAARVALSNVQRELGALEEALAHAKTATQRFPEDSDAWHARALVHAATGELAQAKRCFEKFLQSGAALEAQLEARSMIAMIDRAEPGQRLEFDKGA